MTVDPAHQQVNPSTVDDHLFKSNSRYYGSGAPSGGSSTWDAVPEPEPHETDHLNLGSPRHSSGHRAYHGVIAGTISINNELGNEANDLTGNAPGKGKSRTQNPTDPASRIDHHDPSTKEKFVGKVKVLFGKASGNRDVFSSGDALRKGKVERGNK